MSGNDCELPLRYCLSHLQVPGQAKNIVHQKRNLFYVTKDDILHMDSQDPEESDPIVIPASMFDTVLHLAHDNEAAIHPGIKCTNLILHSCVWWPTMIMDIEEYVRSCNTCRQKNRNPDNNTPQGVTTSARDKPKVTYWSCDILSFPTSSLHWKHLLTILDYKTGGVGSLLTP
jgi:hypothetical protein